MTNLRKAAQQALEALEMMRQKYGEYACSACDNADAAIAALRAALAQQDESEAYGYASRLAVAIWEKHYKDTAPQWKPLDYLIGVLTQIDNMTSGLTRQAQHVEPVEPVAWMCSSPELMAKGYKQFSSRCEGDWNIPVYLAPPQRKPLTDEEIRRIIACIDKFTPVREGMRQLARAIERAHGIGEQP